MEGDYTRMQGSRHVAVEGGPPHCKGSEEKHQAQALKLFTTQLQGEMLRTCTHDTKRMNNDDDDGDGDDDDDEEETQYVPWNEN